MEKDKVFFGKNGLTNASAEHICEMARLAYKKEDEFLKNIKLFNEDVTIISTGTTARVISGYTDEDIDRIPECISKMGKYKELITWLKEAIKARQGLMQEVDLLLLETWAREQGLEYPDPARFRRTFKEEDILADWDTNKRCAYYKAETAVTNLGKVIHPEGHLDKAIVRLDDRLSNPNSISGEGTEITMYTASQSASTEVIDGVVKMLHEQHRKFQAEYNKLKNEIADELSKRNYEEGERYVREFNEYSNKIKALEGQFYIWKANKLEEIRALRIVIPEGLQEVYKEIASK